MNPQETPKHKENYGFKSLNAPPITPELKPFEDGLLQLIQNTEFRTTTNNFQKDLRKQVKKIEHDPNLIIPADKTSNYHKMPPQRYQELLEKNIQKEYKKVDQQTIKKATTKYCHTRVQLGNFSYACKLDHEVV